MALVKCTECGGSISENAKTCPQCGETLGWSWGAKFLLCIVILRILFWITAPLRQDQDPQPVDNITHGLPTPDELERRQRSRLHYLFPDLFPAPPQDPQPVDNITHGLPTTDELERRKSSGP